MKVVKGQYYETGYKNHDGLSCDKYDSVKCAFDGMTNAQKNYILSFDDDLGWLDYETKTNDELWKDTKENLIKRITKPVYDEISFMIGDSVECTEFLSDILDRNGYDLSDGGFLIIDPEHDVKLTLDIYQTLFVEGGLEPFLPD